MIIALLLTLQTPATTFGGALRLPPEIAGDLLLAGREHQPIEAVSVPPPNGPGVPGVEQLYLFERATDMAGGCTRKRWTASFRYTDVKFRNDATFEKTHAASEVALPRSGSCAWAGPFVHVDPGLDPVAAIHGLRQLDRIVSSRDKVVFTCSDATGSDFCGDRDAIRRTLRTLTPGVVSRRDGDLVFWLEKGGSFFADIRFAGGSPDRVTVERRIPAPF